MTIKHIVLSAASYKVLYMIGAINLLNEQKYYKIEEIKSIHGTSAGCLFGLALCLKLDWKNFLDYIINRPWDKDFNFTVTKVIEGIEKKGMLNIQHFYSIFSTPFKQKGLKVDISLKELYEYSKIELYTYAVNLTTFKVEQFSYKTHPDLKAIEAIYMSCCLPFVYQPMKYKDHYYVDGGLEIDYPINQCIELTDNIEEILGVKVIDDEITHDLFTIEESDNIFTYGYYLFYKLLMNNKKRNYLKIENEITIPCKTMNGDDAHKIINNSDERKNIINEGKKIGYLYLKFKNLL